MEEPAALWTLQSDPHLDKSGYFNGMARFARVAL
jgi:hypothetical protein